jgi:DNA-binding NtrC family response regulator
MAVFAGTAMAVLPNFVRFNLIGDSPVFQRTLAVIPRIAGCDATVLIDGETGTGKELAARAVHYLSPRRDFPFIPVNCGAIPDDLIENELFGHARGAYTGAGDPQIGLIAEAEGGTLFLDEVETLTPRAQVALLRFLHDGSYRRLGGRGDLRGNVRIVAASNASLPQMAERGAFRDDLLYRLMVMSLSLPPLRERGDDRPLLANHFLARFDKQYKGGKRGFDERFVHYLHHHHWPGNVRELENLVHRTYLMADSGVLTLPDGLRLPAPAPLAAPAAPAAASLTAYPGGYAAAKAETLANFERSYVSWALREADGNVSRAARHAGKERRSFARLVKKHGIRRAEFAVSNS